MSSPETAFAPIKLHTNRLCHQCERVIQPAKNRKVCGACKVITYCVCLVFFLRLKCLLIQIQSKECQEAEWPTHKRHCFEDSCIPEAALLALMDPVRVQGIYESDPWSPVRIEQAVRKFESYFATPLASIANSAVTAKSKAIQENQPWMLTSTTYGYQFVLGLASAESGASGKKRLGLKSGKLIVLEEFVESNISLQNKAVSAIREQFPDFPAVQNTSSKLVDLRGNISSKYPAIAVVLAVESWESKPYCPPCSFVHKIISSPVSFSFFLQRACYSSYTA